MVNGKNILHSTSKTVCKGCRKIVNNFWYMESEGNLQKEQVQYVILNVVDEKMYYTTTESNRRTHDAHSCKQNRITTTPFNLIVTMPLTPYDQQL
jgi:hypothetical protein